MEILKLLADISISLENMQIFRHQTIYIYIYIYIVLPSYKE